MTNDSAIRVERVSKKYCRSLKHTMLYGMRDIARNSVGLASRSERLREGEFWALDDVSFHVKKGETLGIIGANGSGKSTLLKLLNGIFMPDRGRIEIHGRVGALIEVGAGFHPLLTGRENIYVNGAIFGMRKAQIDKKFDEIVDFADIGDFIDSPVKHYSSGMYVRLGFAVAIHGEPDILLIDEVLAVGDTNFRLKCVAMMKKFQEEGKSIVYVSHEMSTVKKICQNCLWIHKGGIAESGNAVAVVDACVDYLKSRNLQSTATRLLSEAVEIVDVHTEGVEGQTRAGFRFGETVVVCVKYSLRAEVEGLIFGVALFTGDNTCISALHTGLDGVVLKPTIGLNEVRLEYPAINLLSGTYYFDVGFFESNAVAPFSYWNRACDISVETSFRGEGLLVMEHSWRSS